MASSVISAGLSQKDFLYVRDASKPLMERWNMVEPYWEYNRHTGYGQAVDISVKKLYGYSILPVRVIRLLLSMEMYKTTFLSCGIFPSPKIADAPLGPAVVRECLSKILELAVSEHVCFHNLRHPYVKHTTKIFSLRLMDFQAQACPDARRKTRGACQLLRVGQSRSPVRPLCNRKRFSCLPPQSKMSWILYAISMRLSGYTSTRSISSSASSVVSVSASKIALDAFLRLSCRACSSCFCFACANTAA